MYVDTWIYRDATESSKRTKDRWLQRLQRSLIIHTNEILKNSLSLLPKFWVLSYYSALNQEPSSDFPVNESAVRNTTANAIKTSRTTKEGI